MKTKTVIAICAALTLGGCANPPIVSSVATFHNFPPSTSPRGTIAIVSASHIPENLEFQNYAGRISSILATKGLAPASPATAEYIGTFAYGINSGRTELYAAPIFGRTGGGTTFTNGSVYSGGHSASYQGYSYTPATFGVVGAATQSGVVYTRIAELVIKTRQGGKIVWQGRNRSEGMTGEIAVVLPTMIEALLKNFPGKSGKVETITLPFPSR